MTPEERAELHRHSQEYLGDDPTGKKFLHETMRRLNPDVWEAATEEAEARMRELLACGHPRACAHQHADYCFSPAPHTGGSGVYLSCPLIPGECSACRDIAEAVKKERGKWVGELNALVANWREQYVKIQPEHQYYAPSFLHRANELDALRERLEKE